MIVFSFIKGGFMSKKVFYITTKFEAYIDIHDWDDDKKSAILEGINHLPSCDFEFESEEGKTLRATGGSKFAFGSLVATPQGNLTKFVFDGVFKIDTSKRRDALETWLEPALKSGLNIKYAGITIDTSIDKFVFYSMNSKGKDVQGIKIDATVSTTIPKDVNFA